MLRFKIYLGKLDTEKGGYLDPRIIKLGSREIEFFLTEYKKKILLTSAINFPAKSSVLHEIINVTDIFGKRIRLGHAKI